MLARALRLAAFVGVLMASRPAMADIMAVYSLGPASVSGDVVSFDVNLNFAASGAESSYELGFFGLDVTPSSGALTGSGADFSAFSFALNTAQFGGDWALINDFGSGANPGAVQYAAILDLLPSGNYLLGTLSVDLAKAGLSWPLTQALTVSIEGVDTQVGAQDPDDYSTFTYYPGTFNPGSQRIGGSVQPVPEPILWPWMAAACATIIGKRFGAIGCPS